MENDASNSNFVIYAGDGGQPRIEVRIEGETVWLTQAQLAELFDTTKANVSIHTKNIFDEGELAREATVKEYLTVQNAFKKGESDENSVCREFRRTGSDGKEYAVKHYNDERLKREKFNVGAILQFV